LVAFCRSALRSARRVVIVNGHGGNVPALRNTVRRLGQDGLRAAWVPCHPEQRDAHAGRTETSLMLHIAPHLVHMSEAVVGNVTPLQKLMPALVKYGVAQVSPSGILGDPTGASAHEGAHILASVIEDALLRLSLGYSDSNGDQTIAMERHSQPQ